MEIIKYQHQRINMSFIKRVYAFDVDETLSISNGPIDVSIIKKIY